ncbi:MAG TPA: GNAT family N-acetyltransferase [Streptosporangiaceae bacterium]|nr:GNAT family N-acetyltransferase [Streptosporangiaceae bacterium]
MHLEQFDAVADTEKTRACYDMYVAGKPYDDPPGPLMSYPSFSIWLAHGWENVPKETWIIPRDETGVWAGGYSLDLPDKENTHLARLQPFVTPARRRTGIGTALLRHAARRAAGAGRTLLSGNCREDTPGSAFAMAAGARQTGTEVRRVLELASIPAGHLAALRAKAAAAATGYSLVSWLGLTPEEHLDQVAKVINAMEDAPHDPGEEPAIADAGRLRESEQHILSTGARAYNVAARHDATGELAGLTSVFVEPTPPDWGYQGITAVTRAHRGHRLGLLMKVAMLDWLAQAEPQIERITTGNAGANAHMIAINAEIGYHVLDSWPSWQLDVAQVLGDPVPGSAGTIAN